MKQVSVIIPCFNAESTLASTLDSVIAQDWQDLEIIVVDDGSTDLSAEIARCYEARDRRVRYLRNPRKGVSAARNFGVACAQGTYFAFLDADDLWLPGKTRAQVAVLESDSTIGVSYGCVSFTTTQGAETGHYSSPGQGALSSWDLLVENPVCTSSNIFVSRDAWNRTGSFNEQMSFAEDQEWLIRCVQLSGFRVKPIPDVLVHYRASESGLSADLQRMENGWRQMARLAVEREPALEEQIDSAHAIYLRYLARRALRLGMGPETTARYLHHAFSVSAKALLRQPRRTLPLVAAVGIYAVLPTALAARMLQRFGVMA